MENKQWVFTAPGGTGTECFVVDLSQGITVHDLLNRLRNPEQTSPKPAAPGSAKKRPRPSYLRIV